ncbi:MAG: ATP-binding protein [Myxococcota bacterium]
MTSPAPWRARLASELLVALAGLSLLLSPPVVWLLGMSIMGWGGVIGGCTLVLVVAAAARHRLPYGVHVSLIVGITAFAHLAGCIAFGPIVGPTLAGTVATTMGGLLGGPVVGLVALWTLSLGMVAIGTLIDIGALDLPRFASTHFADWTIWLGEAGAFVWFNAVLSVVVHLAVRRIERARADVDVAQRVLSDTEQQVRQLQRLETVGRLAGGLAHDFNNTLLVTMASAEELDELPLEVLGPTEADHARQAIRDIRSSSESAAELTARLLAFSRRDLHRPEVLDLAELVRDVTRSLRRLLPETVQLTVDAPASGPFVEADRTQLRQVLLNLAVNARDAMPGGGTLTLVVRREADTAMLSVADTGTGIPEAIRSDVFDPFFTTKAAGSGSGLGLSTVFGIVQQHGGTVTFETAEGQGTTFVVRLPGLDSAEVAAVRPPPAEVPIRKGRILLAEDQPLVRRSMVRGLVRHGFVVTEAEDVPSAIAALRTGRFDLLCTDGIMPGGTTRDLIDAFRLREPDRPILVCSGYLEESPVLADIGAGRSGFLRKPFTTEQLVAEVAKLLDRAG